MSSALPTGAISALALATLCVIEGGCGRLGYELLAIQQTADSSATPTDAGEPDAASPALDAAPDQTAPPTPDATLGDANLGDSAPDAPVDPPPPQSLPDNLRPTTLVAGIRPATPLGASVSHTCAQSGTRLLCWGDGADGRLGGGNTTSRLAATEVSGGGTWNAVASGAAFSCALQGDAPLCFGTNSSGQIAQGASPGSTSPVPVGGLPALAWLSAGANHACALGTDESLWCWGSNDDAQLGIENVPLGNDATTPVQMGNAAEWVDGTAGTRHTCGIRRPGTLWCWGDNAGGQLGTGVSAGASIQTMTRVGSSLIWRYVVAGESTTCAVKRDKSLWCWGDNAFGQLGLFHQQSTDMPEEVQAGTFWDDFDLGPAHTCAIDTTGALYCWGRNDQGQLGLGTTRDQWLPRQVGTDTDWIGVSLGEAHTCARKSNGSVWCTGANGQGQLGTGDTTGTSALVEVL